MIRLFIKFSIKLILILSTVFIIHECILNYLKLPLYADKIVSSYIINSVLAIAIFGLLLALKTKYSTQLGFVFLAGSVLKFVVFFIVFYPFYKADDVITKTEFLAFFVPYAMCLIIETTSLAKWLNKTA